MSSIRYFVTYSGVKLPFNLSGELQEQEIKNRNTYFKGYYDEAGRLTGFDKIAYGSVELAHRYSYHPNGKIGAAEITDIDEETTTLTFDEEGQAV